MWGHVWEYLLPTYLVNSALLLLGAGILTLIIGVGAAWVVTQYEFRGRKIGEFLLFLPLAIPSYIMAYAYVGLFGPGGSYLSLQNWLGISLPPIEIMNLPGLVWVLSLSLFPYVYVSTRAFFMGNSQKIKEAAILLGCSEKRYFLRIALPLAAPAIGGGIFLVWMEALNDYGAAKYYGVNTFTTGIFRTWTGLEDLKSAIYLSVILLLFVFGLLLIARWLRGRRSFSISQDESVRPNRKPLRGKAVFFCWLAIGTPILFGLIFPIGQLIKWALLPSQANYTQPLWKLSLQSLTLAISAATVTVIIALCLSYFARWNKLKSIQPLVRSATVGYALPGAIIGIAVISSSQVFINFFAQNFSWNIGYLFFGSSFVLIYAYTFRFLAVAFYPLNSSMLKIGNHLSEAAFTLGASKTKTILKIEFPLLRPALISAFILVFIDSLKELPLTLILKPHFVNTLAVSAYKYADDEQMSRAAEPALILISIVGCFLLITLLLSRSSTNTASK